MVPNSGRSNDSAPLSSSDPPKNSGITDVTDEIRRPAPSRIHGWPRESRRTAGNPPWTYRKAIAAPATIPPTNPPPGWLCPANSSQMEPTITAANTMRTDTSMVTMRVDRTGGGAESSA